MVTIQQTELKEGILQAINRAVKLSTPILVSEVQKISSITPLGFFAAAKGKYNGERFFWKHPSRERYMVGIGICKEITTDQVADRFFHVEEEWKRFTNEAIILNMEEIEGTGPTAFGGFSFDPSKEKTMRWSKFSSSLFHIPKYMLSVIDGQAFLTTNIVCTGLDDPFIYHHIELERNEMLVNAQKMVKFDDATLEETLEGNTEAWKRSVTKVIQDLKNQKGILRKVVLARELRLRFDKDILVESVLNRLLTEHLDSFVFAFESKGDCFIGASPERLVKKENEHVYSTCLAGSIARGITDEEDKLLGESLLNDSKNLIEHQYVVDMIREAMESTCSEVTIPPGPDLLKLTHIQHLYTPVKGRVKWHTSLLDLVKELHPTPALGGLPKEPAMEKIRDIEELDRGFYAGPIGWFDHQGNGDFAVAIRSGLIQGKEVSLFAGCGVVEDSMVEEEFEETNIKFKPMLSALGGLKP